MKLPATHKFNERKLIKMVESGELHITYNGQIWRLKRKQGIKTGGIRFLCVEPVRAERTHKGYYTIRGMINGTRYTTFAHRLVWQNFYGDIPDGYTINHKNGDKQDNRPENLELATLSEQAKHCYFVLRKRSQLGSQNNRAKLSDGDVWAIRKMRNGGKKIKEIAKVYNVSFKTISKIIRNERWKHI